MFRFASQKTALVTTATILRFQSSAVAAEASTPSSSSSAGATAKRRSRYFTPTRLLPKFEIHDVRDEPALGSMTRVSIDGKQLLISQHPQLGPRKMDPNDAAPQFDRDRRISLRLRHMDLAALTCVVKGWIPRHRMRNNAYDITFEKTEPGYVLQGQVHRGNATTMEEWALRFERQFAVTLEHFLDSALTESFGFQQHQRFLEEGNAMDSATQNNSVRNRNNDNVNNNNRSSNRTGQRRNDNYRSNQRSD